MYYANGEHFIDKLFQKSGVNPRKLRAAQVKVENRQQKEIKQREKELRKRNIEVSMVFAQMISFSKQKYLMSDG